MEHPMFEQMKANNIKEYEDLPTFEALVIKPIGYFVVKKRNGETNPALYYYDGTTIIRSNVDENIQEWGSFF
jgi:hypothetical protein